MHKIVLYECFDGRIIAEKAVQGNAENSLSRIAINGKVYAYKVKSVLL